MCIIWVYTLCAGDNPVAVRIRWVQGVQVRVRLWLLPIVTGNSLHRAGPLLRSGLSPQGLLRQGQG